MEEVCWVSYKGTPGMIGSFLWNAVTQSAAART